VMTRAPHALSKDPSLEDLTATLYGLFGVDSPVGTDGQPLFQ
jgi:arylsulfatase A-like enzyme